MPIELRIESGARAGHVESFDKSIISIGRHPMMDLRFDPKQDLDVSTRHGEIRFTDGKYAILDSQSTNGTFVNGQRIARGGLRELHDNDIIAFGATGPKVRVRLAGKLATPTHGFPSARELETPPATLSGVGDTEERSSPASTPAKTPAASAPPMAAPARTKRTTGERVAIAVAEQTRNLKLIAGAAVIVLGGLAAGMYFKTKAANTQIDTLLAELKQQQEDFASKLGANSAIVELSKKRSDSLAKLVRESKGAAQQAAAEQLRRDGDLRRAVVNMDASAIAANNKKAIVLITSAIGNGKPSEATGFVVNPSGLIVTNRHVVVDENGNRATDKIFVRLTENTAIRRAHLVRVLDDSVDLALLQIEGAGPFPTVRGIAPHVDADMGAAIVTLGFPLGTDLPQEGGTVEPTLTMGSVARSIKDLLQLDSWATNGASGSPVFDTHGHVIGVIYGGDKNAKGRIVYAVPAERVNELIKNAK
jgi:S1-C subfamily serine protease